MVMVDLMTTAMRTYEACALRAMLDAQGNRVQQYPMRQGLEGYAL
jgi:hypothetical protein